MVKIRSVKTQEIERVERIERQSFSDPYPIEIFRILFESMPELFLVAVDSAGKQICGYGVASIHRRDERIFGHIVSIAVDPAYRRRGIGTKIIRELIRRLQHAGCSGVSLEVRVTNIPALSMYGKLGFTQLSIIRNYYRDGEDAALMHLPLGESQ